MFYFPEQESGVERSAGLLLVSVAVAPASRLPSMVSDPWQVPGLPNQVQNIITI